MIIRSQDKRKLTNFAQVTDLVVSKNRTAEFEIIACYSYFADSDCGFASIGTYSTEAKAIKVLDMIEDACRNMAFTDGIVFRMPQDSEV